MESLPQYDSRDVDSQHLLLHVEGRHGQTETVEESRFKEGCIFRVSESFREGKEKEFTPFAVAIGPIHRATFINKEEEKEKYSKAFIRRTKLDCVAVRQKIISCVRDIKRCYAGTTVLSYCNDELVEMMIKDGCFILEHLLKIIDEKKSIASEELQDRDIWSDIILIENQVPLIVLEIIYACARRRPSCTFLELIFGYFKLCNDQEIKPTGVHCVHFVDLLRFFLLPPLVRGGSEERSIEVIDLVYSASELLTAGLEFKASESQCLLDINFQGRILTMPRWTIHVMTERYLRNVLAYEDRCYCDSEYVLEYFYVLKFLVKDEKDAKILTDNGIIFSMIGGEYEVASMIQRLSLHISINKMSSKYQTICEDLNAFPEYPDNKAKAKLKRKYCGSICMKTATYLGALAVVVALIVFFILQSKKGS